MIAGAALTALIHRCAPDVRPATMVGIVRVESGGDPYAIDDNTTGRRYEPNSKARAVALLTRLLKAGHQVDAGLAQIDSENFGRYGLTSRTVFSACRNVHAGAEIFRQGYQKAEHAGLSGQLAVYHAFEAYNSGRLYGDAHYANAVLHAAGLPVTVEHNAVAFHHLDHWHGSPFAASWDPGKGGFAWRAGS